MPSVYTSAASKADSAVAVAQNQTAVSSNEETLQSVSDSVNFSSSEKVSRTSLKPEKAPTTSSKKAGSIPTKFFGGDVSRAESVADKAAID